MYFMFLVSRKILSANFNFRYTPSFGWWRTAHSYSGKNFEDKGEKIEEQNNQGILGAIEGYTKWRCHMGRREFFAAYKYEISWGQAILGGEDCNVPILK